MKKTNKTILLAIVLTVIAVTAFAVGSVIGRNGKNNEVSSQQVENGGNVSSQEENRISDNIYDLVTALDAFVNAEVQIADVDVELKFGSLDLDQEFVVKTGVIEEKQISHIQKGKLDIYICDGEVFVEEDNAHLSFDKVSYGNINMRRMFAIAYEVVSNGDFEVKTSDNETVYSLTLTQQQIENIFNTFQSTMDDMNISLEKGVLKIVTENGKMEQMEIVCSGYTQILTSQVEGSISVEAELATSSQQALNVPQSVLEQIK